MTTRVRFAPAPTGFLHVGSARSALYNWLWARHTGGVLVLRIEDTNAELAKPEFYDAITEPLKWLGIEWDEGPFHQSERERLYLDAIAQLLAAGAAYFCDCTRDAIDARAKAAGGSGYDGHCRTRGVSDGADVVVRFATPDDGETVVNDIIRGEVRFANAELEDFVIRRSNGTPVFLVANAVDDADMAITHVVRGEDLLNTTPKVLLLWRALGLGDEPTYAHLPLLVGEDRKKLSKRKHSVALGDFRAKGYLPEAMVNHLALLGWGPPDDVEIRSPEELAEVFDLAAVNKGAAFYDLKKLDHLNGHYIRQMSTEDFMTAAEPWLTGEEAPWPADRFDADRFARYLPLIQEKLVTLADTPRYCDFLFLDDPDIDEASWEKAMVKGPHVPEILDGVIAALADCAWDAETVKDTVFGVGESFEVNKSKTQAPVRVAVTGRTVGPPLFETLADHMTRDEVLRRLRAARARL